MVSFGVGFYSIVVLAALKVWFVVYEFAPKVLLYQKKLPRKAKNAVKAAKDVPKNATEAVKKAMEALKKAMKALKKATAIFKGVKNAIRKAKSVVVGIPEKLSALKRSNRLTLSSLALSLLMGVLGGVAFLGLRVEPSGDEGLCTNADADIIGDGVRIGTWILVGVLFLTAVLGSFLRDAATKELGAGLLVTHVSLAIALVIPLARRKLSPIDAILGALILDVQSSAMAIQLTAKETLASRWQTVLALLSQVLGLSIEGILVNWFSKDWLFKNDKCSCFSVFWWSWFSNCANVTPNTAIPFWIYFGLRWVYVVHMGWLALSEASKFDMSKKVDWSLLPNNIGWISNQGETGCSAPPHPDFCGRCGKCTTCRRPAQAEYLVGDRKYSERFMTVNSMFLENAALSLLSIASAESTIKVNSVQLTSDISSVGQAIALVIAVGTGVRAIWVILYQFKGEDEYTYNVDNTAVVNPSI
ncbi:hypothetical protein F4678DRAFT_485665 [Xylaria arbuscula]|nr:hypothetical protein F4678DRAFT_485665 [Xylaria arbuscula]